MIHGRGAQLKDLLEQLEAEHARIAVLLIRQGAVTDDIEGREDCVFGRVSRQLVRFQEEVEEITDELLGAQAKCRRVCEQEVRKSMLEVRNQLQSKYSGRKLKKLFNNMKARIEQLQIDVDIVMEKRSQESWMSGTPMSPEMVEEHDKLYQQCYSWMRDTKRSNMESKTARLRAQSPDRAANRAINRLLKKRLLHGLAHRKV